MKYGIAIIMLLAITGCDERWEGFFYPDKADLTHHHFLGSFNSLEACRAVARHKMQPGADYECGLNCKSNPEATARVCEKTVR